MTRVRFNVTISIDGYLAGPDQSLANPLGVGGLDLHAWMFPLAAFRSRHGESGGEVNASSIIVEESLSNAGAFIMGRHMFGGGDGPWSTDPPWNGWWGENPPYHAPVFVLTHHPRAPLVAQGGTTFTFVTTGIASALDQARAVCAGKDIVIAGGAQTIQQYLAAGVIDEVNVSITPILLRAGERLFEHLPPSIELSQVRVIDAANVTHIRYAVRRSDA